MPKPKKQKSEQLPQPSDHADEGSVETDVLPELETNGHAEPEAAEPVEAPEPPAKVKYQVEGTPRAVQAAARKIANAPPVPVVTPSNELEPPPDDTDALLADGHNMVVVRRQFPKTVEMQDGSKRRCAVKLGEPYQCPTTREEIENDVFARHGGWKYKCTIHPATTKGEETVLAYFTIEHPNQDELPYFEDDPRPEPEFDPRTSAHTSGTDRTMHETDGLAKLRDDANRRLERARVRKEMKELEAEAKRLEDEIDGTDNKSVAPVVPVGESDEIRKLREQNAQLQAQLAEKKVNDRFDKLEDSIAKLATTITAGATAKPAASGEDSIMLKMLNQSQQHAKDMIEMMRDKKPAVPPSAEGDLDKFLDRVTKLQTITGSTPGNKGGGTRLSELENKLIDMSFDRLTDSGGGGGDGGDDPEDVAKLAVKEFAPILKTFVEKKMDQADRESGGAPVTEEMKRRIYAEAAQAASKKVVEDLAAQGIHLGQDQTGKLIALAPPKPGAAKTPVTPRQLGSRVVSEQRTSGGVVKKIAIEPADLSEKKRVAAEAPARQAEPTKGDESMAKCGEFPMLGDGGATLKIPFPVRPGELKYDRKYAVDFVLDGIRSEIRQGLPQKAATDQRIESYVIGDAIEYLDDEILDQISAIDSGPQLETLLGPWGDAPKIAEIKKSGDDEIVASYLRKLVLSIQREWEREKAAPPKN